MGSTRLPGKSMKFLSQNLRLIDFVIINALNSKYINKKNIYLLTSRKRIIKLLLSMLRKNTV